MKHQEIEGISVCQKNSKSEIRPCAAGRASPNLPI
ncbi:MAG: hypothetical protein MRERV_17c044 [Mycoplasmataceae bacterium RV_VA103A]|nr:MAG: hypothetical protein MRERV_17c044 [Mycoplasmataceae bacterium RV_VA103A]